MVVRHSTKKKLYMLPFCTMYSCTSHMQVHLWNSGCIMIKFYYITSQFYGAICLIEWDIRKCVCQSSLCSQSVCTVKKIEPWGYPRLFCWLDHCTENFNICSVDSARLNQPEDLHAWRSLIQCVSFECGIYFCILFKQAKWMEASLQYQRCKPWKNCIHHRALLCL